MTSFKVVKEGGIEVNGSEYAEGHVFTFEGEVPEHIQPFVDDGRIVEVDLTEPKENTMVEDTEEKKEGQSDEGQKTEGESSNDTGSESQSDSDAGKKEDEGEKDAE